MHLTVSLPSNICAVDKLLEKARSFNLTDYNTPIIGEFYAKVREIWGKDIVPLKGTEPMRRWSEYDDLCAQYPNRKDDWMIHYAENVLPGFQRQAFLKWLASCKTLDSLLNSPQHMEQPAAKSAAPVVVDGDIIGPEEDHKHSVAGVGDAPKKEGKYGPVDSDVTNVPLEVTPLKVSSSSELHHTMVTRAINHNNAQTIRQAIAVKRYNNVRMKGSAENAGKRCPVVPRKTKPAQAKAPIAPRGKRRPPVYKMVKPGKMSPVAPKTKPPSSQSPSWRPVHRASGE